MSKVLKRPTARKALRPKPERISTAPPFELAVVTVESPSLSMRATFKLKPEERGPFFGNVLRMATAFTLEPIPTAKGVDRG